MTALRRRLALFWLSVKIDCHRGAFVRCYDAEQWEWAEQHASAVLVLRRERARLRAAQ